MHFWYDSAVMLILNETGIYYRDAFDFMFTIIFVFNGSILPEAFYKSYEVFRESFYLNIIKEWMRKINK